MQTQTVKADINSAHIPVIEAILRQFKAKNISFEEVKKQKKQQKDDTLMTKEAYFAMLDEASIGKKTRMSLEEMKAYLKTMK